MNVFKIGSTIIAGAAAAGAFGQASLQLYHAAEGVKDQGITLKGWGSGTVSETDETYYTNGAHSLRISTRNFFQGGVINFGNPIDLAKQFGDKNNLLRLTYKPASGTVQRGGAGGLRGGTRGFPGGPGGPGGGPRGGGGQGFPGAGIPGGGGGGLGGQNGGQGLPGGFPGGFPGGVPGAGGQGGFPGGGFPGGGQGIPGFGGQRGGLAANAAPVLKTLRVIVTTTDMKKSEAYLSVDTSTTSDEESWRQIAIPLQAISGFDRTNKVIKSVAISGDATTTLFLGELGVVEDSTPIRGVLNVHGTLNVALGDEFQFTATGSGGATPLKYSWNFDSEHFPGQVDVEGRTVRRKFRKEGLYTVTMTVSDMYDLKTPYQTSFKVLVNP